MPIIDVLRDFPEFPECREQLPDWLQNFSPSFNREDFFDPRYRTLYYPGSGFDGHPIRVCSRARAVHTFVYVDDGVTAEKIVSRLKRFQLQGYDIEHLENLNEEQLVGPNGWMPAHGNLADYDEFEGTIPFYLYVVLCRNPGFDRKRGPKKLAILFIGRDGFETFDNLYCQNNWISPPFLIVVETYRFPGGELLQYVGECNALPEFLLVVEDGPNAWDGYQYTGASELTRTDGAMCREIRRRYLYVRP